VLLESVEADACFDDIHDVRLHFRVYKKKMQESQMSFFAEEKRMRQMRVLTIFTTLTLICASREDTMKKSHRWVFLQGGKTEDEACVEDVGVLKMCVCRKCVCIENVCVSKMCVCRKCVCIENVCVSKMCVCRKCVCIENVCVLKMCVY